MNSLKKTLLIVLQLMFYQVYSWAQEVPKVLISNGIIDAEVYLPDAENGYYRGSRFDWSGVIPQLHYKGHTFFGQWFEKYDPELHDAIVGPVEAFSPIGYDQAKVGETFTQIGIGLLEKLDSSTYHFSKPYKIVDHGEWTVKQGDDQVEFTHVLNNGRYQYEYKKTIRLSGNKMIIEHTLINKGNQIIETQVYDHNFFVIDNDNIGPGYVIQFPFEIKSKTNRLGDFAKVDYNQIQFIKALGENDHPNLRSITGYRPLAEDYNIVIENRNTGAGVRITGDQPIVKLEVWSAIKTVCPEPYIQVKVQPSDSFSWTITYDYYTL